MDSASGALRSNVDCDETRVSDDAYGVIYLLSRRRRRQLLGLVDGIYGVFGVKKRTPLF